MFGEVENDHSLNAEQETLKAGQRALSRALRDNRPRRTADAKRIPARRSRCLPNRHKDRTHQVAIRLMRAR